MPTAPTVSAQAVELVDAANALLDRVMADCDDENARLLTDMFLNLAKFTQQEYVARHHCEKHALGSDSDEAHQARQLADEYCCEARQAAEALIEQPASDAAEIDYAAEIRRTQNMEPR